MILDRPHPYLPVSRRYMTLTLYDNLCLGSIQISQNTSSRHGAGHCQYFLKLFMEYQRAIRFKNYWTKVKYTFNHPSLDPLNFPKSLALWGGETIFRNTRILKKINPTHTHTPLYSSSYHCFSIKSFIFLHLPEHSYAIKQTATFTTQLMEFLEKDKYGRTPFA